MEREHIVDASKMVEAANEYVDKHIAENDGSYFGWNADDIAIAKAAFIAGAKWITEQLDPEFRKTRSVEKE